MRARLPILLAAVLSAAILPGGYVLKGAIRDETAPIWSRCTDMESETVDGRQPYRAISGDLHGLTEDQVDALFFHTLKGWVRTKHIQCFISPTCYINNRTGTRIEFQPEFTFDPKARPPFVFPMHIYEVRKLNEAEMLAYQASYRFKSHENPYAGMIPPPLEPGPVSSGDCWVQPYGTHW